jgi:hypothetical protein
MFWLHMNQGLWFSSPKKIALTLLNTLAIIIGIILVSPFSEFLYLSGYADERLLVCSWPLCFWHGYS